MGLSVHLWDEAGSERWAQPRCHSGSPAVTLFLNCVWLCFCVVVSLPPLLLSVLGLGLPHPSNPVSVTGDQRATRTKGQEVFLSDPVPPPSLTIGTGEEALVVRGCCSHVRGPADLPLPGADGIGRAVIGWTESMTVS